MKQIVIITLLLTLFFISIGGLHAQNAPAKQWDKTLGGSAAESLSSIHQTPDGGYIMGGGSNSGISGDKSQPSKGGSDLWAVKVDANGSKQWDKTIGGNDMEEIFVLLPTSDGGYILGGNSSSGVSGDKTQPNKGYQDYWVVKLDANGNKVWDKTFGGTGVDRLRTLVQTSDGGYILGGQSDSNISSDKSQASRGGLDYWIIKIDATGNKVWDKVYGGSSSDWCLSILQIPGGYLLNGGSYSSAGLDKTQASKGDSDGWLIKIDLNGNKLWDKVIGGSLYDTFFEMQHTIGGDIIMASNSNSGIGGDKSQANQGIYDYWLVKVDSNGNKIWDKTFGGSGWDVPADLIQDVNGNFFLIGESNSTISGDKTEDSKGASDYWMIKTDANGNKLWDKVYGGNDSDGFRSAKITSDGGFILAGDSESDISGDKSENSKGGYDIWIIKLGPEVTGIDEWHTSTIKLYPNPSYGLINLEINEKQAVRVIIYNSIGKKVFEEENLQIGLNQLDLSTEAKGIYLIQVVGSGINTTRKILVE